MHLPDSFLITALGWIDDNSFLATKHGCFESIDAEAEVKDKIKHLNQILNEAKLELAELIIQRN